MSSKAIRMYSTAAAMLLSGTYGFHVTEGLSLIDSFYLSGITFTTIGYGDLPAPATRNGKMLMMVFSLLAIGFFANVVLPYGGELRDRLDGALFGGGSNKLRTSMVMLVVNAMLGAGICSVTRDPGLPSINEPLDLFYWSFVTGTTIGYGDFAPQTDNGKLLTVLYALLSLQTTSAAADAVWKWLNDTFIGIGSDDDSTKTKEA